jgi:predicted ester cyclase
MPGKNNQENKTAVWDYWQKLNHVGIDNIPDVVRAAVHKDVNWNGSAPIDHLDGVESLISEFWLPLYRSFPDLKRKADVFMGGEDAKGDEWVSGCGYLTGTFAQDWLGIPATNEKINIHFGQFYVMREGKIAESYVIFDILGVMRQAGFQILPPARGMEGGKIPGPVARDGVLLTDQDELESRQSLQLTSIAMNGLRRYVRSRDGGDMSCMEHEHYWHPQMRWFGLTGIGCCFDTEEFEDFHQRPWLHGFGDRDVSIPGGRGMGFVGEGLYSAGGIWDVAFSINHGDYLGYPATGKMMTLRDFDWWKREGDLLIENWVSIDMIDLFRQMDVDLFDELRRQIEQRKQGRLS